MSAIVKEAPSRLGSLILAWLLSQHDGGTPHQITKALNVFLDERVRDEERRRVVDAECNVITRAGWVAHVRKSAVTLTADGRRAALAFLDWKTLPAKADWRSIKKRLSARALDLPFNRPESTPSPPAKIDDGAAILARHYQLAVGPTPTIQEVFDSLLWRALNVETNEPYTVQAALKVRLNQMLDSVTSLTIEQALEQLLAKAALPPVKKVLPALPTDDTAFAARVLAAARSSKSGRFGDDKVFISHVLKELEREGVEVGDISAFKQRLVAVHRRGLLSLSRADLVEAMAPADIDASESQYLSATFHFVGI